MTDKTDHILFSVLYSLSGLLAAVTLGTLEWNHIPYARGVSILILGLGIMTSTEFVHFRAGKPGLWFGTEQSVLRKVITVAGMILFVMLGALLFEITPARHPEFDGNWRVILWVVFVGVFVISLIDVGRRIRERSSGNHGSGRSQHW